MSDKRYTCPNDRCDKGLVLGCWECVVCKGQGLVDRRVKRDWDKRQKRELERTTREWEDRYE